jgi:hypothetical protein
MIVWLIPRIRLRRLILLRQMTRDGRGGHATGIAQAEDVIGELDVVLCQMWERGPAEALENQRHQCGRAGLAHEALDPEHGDVPHAAGHGRDPVKRVAGYAIASPARPFHNGVPFSYVRPYVAR